MDYKDVFSFLSDKGCMSEGMEKLLSGEEFKKLSKQKTICEIWDGKCMNRGQLGDLFGVSRKIFNKMISDMVEDGLLNIGKRRVLYPPEIRKIIEVYG